MSTLALSVLLSLVSAAAYAAGAIVQERVAVGAPARPYAPMHSAVWWVAIALNGLGALLHVLALAYGPLSLVQPLGALTLVLALPMAALFAGGAAGAGAGAGAGARAGAGATAWRGALMATAGLAGLLALTGAADSGAGGGQLGGGERLVLSAAAFGTIAAFFVTAQRVRRAVVRGVLLAGGAGVAFGVASVFTKTVVADWLDGAPGGAAPLPSLLVIAGLGATGLLLSQASYRGAGLTAPLATVTVVNPVVAAAVGITLLGERFQYGATGAVLALVCATVAAAGLTLLTAERPTAAPAPDTPYASRKSHASQTSEAPEASQTSEVPEASEASDRDASRAQVRERIDVGAVPRPRAHLEVEVRSGAVAGGS
ncbi:DMT family transporter [Streptomyces sp. NPDC054841]